MENEILFTEKQKFSQWWFWLILIGINGLFVYGIFIQVIGGEHFGDKPMSDVGLIFSTIITSMVSVLILNFRLETIIKKDGIYVRFFPFHFNFKHYSWDNLSKIYVRQYSALLDYGGWGIRLGIFGKGKAYNVSGNMGLQLEFKDNKKLLIGTKKPEQITEVLKNIGQLKPS